MPAGAARDGDVRLGVLDVLPDFEADHLRAPVCVAPRKSVQRTLHLHARITPFEALGQLSPLLPPLGLG